MSHTPAVPQNDKLDFKRILPIFVIVLVDLLGLTIIIPLLPLYAAAFGATPLMIGIIGATYPLMQLIGGPILGSLSDRFGRKPVLVVSQVGTFIGFILLGFANALPLLLLSRAIDGLSGANIVSAQAAITDSTNDRTRAQGLGLIGAAFGLGFTIGPAIAGISLALTNNDYRVPAFIAAGFSLLSILLTMVWFKETLPAENRHKKTDGQKRRPLIQRVRYAFSLPVVGMLLFTLFIKQMVFGGFEQLLPLFTLSRLGLDGAGNAVLFIFVGVILVLVQGKYIGPLSRRYGERKLILVGLTLIAIGLTIASITPNQPVTWYSRAEMLASMNVTDTTTVTEGGAINVQVELPDDSNTGWLGLLWMAAALIPTSIGGGIVTPSINALITKRVPKTEYGAILGVSASLVSAANVLTPLVGGALFQFLGSTAPFLLGGLVLAVLVSIAVRRIAPGVDQVQTTTA